MQDNEPYQHIPGQTSPWLISDVKLGIPAEKIQVSVEHPVGTEFCCPDCQKERAGYDHSKGLRWWRLGLCKYKTVLIGRVLRVDSPEHGVKTVTEPWALPHSRFTIMFERFAIEVLLMTQTAKGAMTILRLQWDATLHVIERAVARGKARKEPTLPLRIGIDEKASAKGGKYVSILYNLDSSTVEAIEEGHDTEAAKSCFSQLSQEPLKSVEAISMDMSPAFVRAAKEMIPIAESKFLHDKFHIMKMANEAVDKVSLGEHKRLLKDGDDRLKGSKYFLLTSLEHHSEKQHAKFQSNCNLSLATGRAWSYREFLQDLWVQETEGKANSYFRDWYQRVIRTKMAPMKKLARSLNERIDNIVTYCTHGITNAVAEGINGKIMSIKRRAGGYRNIGNFKTAVLFYCGGLNLDPR
jgi:transposase